MRDQSQENRTGLAFSRLCGASGLAPAHDQRSTIDAATGVACIVFGICLSLAGPAVIERAATMLALVLEWH